VGETSPKSFFNQNIAKLSVDMKNVNAIFRLKTHFGDVSPAGGSSEGLPAWHLIDNGSTLRHQHVYEISGS